MKSDWPFDQPRDCAVITIKSIVHGDEPILLVVHDADDQGWQFLNNRKLRAEDAAVVALEEIVRLDPTVLEVAAIPPGWYASRDSKTSDWIRVQSAE